MCSDYAKLLRGVQIVQTQNNLCRYLPAQRGDFVKVVARKAQLASRSCYPKGDLAAPRGKRHVLILSESAGYLRLTGKLLRHARNVRC